MRRTLLAGAVAFIVGGVATGAVLSQAQPAPPPPQGFDGSPPRPGMMDWRHDMMRRHMHQRPFALIYRQEDRELSPADVQKIAESFLLWNGNHTWKVTNVAPTAEGPIAFSLTTPEGSVVAKFTMDPHTGHLERIG